MNPITRTLLDHMTLVYFVYGLAFFVLGLALLLARGQNSDLRFARALHPLAAFGVLHAAHEWVEMFQLMRPQAGGPTAGEVEEWARLGLLVASFVALLWFGAVLATENAARTRRAWLVAGPLAVWGVGAVWVVARHGGMTLAAEGEAEALARYCLAMPGALLGTWGIMAQQRAFRAQALPGFGVDLVWCAAALFLYGVVGQSFVRATALPPSDVLNSALFLAWFGFPVQLFRALMAVLLTVCMVRVLRAFEVERQRQLNEAYAVEAAAREHSLSVERRAREQEARMNVVLQGQARELALLLDLSNLLATPERLSERLAQALRQIVKHLAFADGGLVLLAGRSSSEVTLAALTGLDNEPGEISASADSARALGVRCLEVGRAVCMHADGARFEFELDAVVVGQICWQHASPTSEIAFPLAGQGGLHGALVLVRRAENRSRLDLADLRLLAGVGQQMGLSIENALLYQDAQARERLLANLLHQVVGAQEAERKRIARDLHDATAQSLTAITLGLRGLETALAGQGSPLQGQMQAIYGFANEALMELRRLIADLRPPQLDDLGLVPALRWLLQSMQQRHPATRFRLEVEGELPRLAPEVETLLFRIVQESLTNVIKHARADEAVVRVERRQVSGARQLVIQVVDNGVGFDAARTLSRTSSGWGLHGIRERVQLLGGELDIYGGHPTGAGTTVEIRTPIAAGADEPRTGVVGVTAEAR